jgi:uncharacterized RDD family membrane protein YckC
MVKAIDIITSNSHIQGHWLRRIIAAIIDVFILAIVITIVVIVLDIMGVFGGGVILGTGFLTFVLLSLVQLFYFAFLEATSGSTIGKRLMSLRVVSVSGPMDITKGIIRNISKIVPYFFVILGDFILGFIMDGDPRQRFTDRLANTTVVRTDIQEVIPGAYRPGTGPAPSPAVPQPQQPHYDATQSQPPQPSYSSETQPYEPEPTTSPAIAQEEEIVGPDIKETGEETHIRSELVSLRKDDLVKIARDRGMKTSGTKRDLIDRILGEGD